MAPCGWFTARSRNDSSFSTCAHCFSSGVYPAQGLCLPWTCAMSFPYPPFVSVFRDADNRFARILVGNTSQMTGWRQIKLYIGTTIIGIQVTSNSQMVRANNLRKSIQLGGSGWYRATYGTRATSAFFTGHTHGYMNPHRVIAALLMMMVMIDPCGPCGPRPG